MHRKSRHQKALDHLWRTRRPATAFDLGNAATNGEHRQRYLTRYDKENIGLRIGADLVTRGRVTATPTNLFRIKYQQKTPETSGPTGRPTAP